MFKDCAILTIVIGGNGFTGADEIEVLTRTQLVDGDGVVVEDATYNVTDNSDKLDITQVAMGVGAIGGENVPA